METMDDVYDRLYWLIDNKENEVAAACSCGWTGPWRDMIADARQDGRAHYRKGQTK